MYNLSRSDGMNRFGCKGVWTMKRIYFTAVPLQSNFVLQPVVPQAVNFELTDSAPRCFPIIRIMAQTMKPGDEAVLVIVRQQNSPNNENYDLIVQELNGLNLAKVQIKDLTLPESQDRNVLVGMFRAMIGALEPNACYYACMTFGTKSWPLVLMSVFNYAEKILDNVQIMGVYYQEALRCEGKIIQTRMYDMSVLLSLNSVVDLVTDMDDDSNQKEETIRILLEGC